MLEFVRRGQRWLTALVVAFVGGVFAVFIGLGGGPLRGGAAGAVVTVGPYQLGIYEFERVRTQREGEIRDALGDAFDARKMRETIDAAATRVLIERAILALEAERLGLTVTKGELEREILSLPGLRNPETGRFDKEAFDNWVAYEFGSERTFREQQRRATLAGKLLRVIQTQADVSEGEAREAVVRRLEGAALAYVALDPAAIPEGFERDEAAIEAFLAENEAAARDLYEERSDQYDVPERTRARHILLRLEKGASEEEVAAVESRAREVVDRLQAGEDFAAVAEEVSEDPGSKAAGGDLGYFQRGQMVPPFEEVAFGLEPGARSDLVRTDYGIHIIQVEDRKPAELVTFEDVRADLAYELLGQQEGSRVARELAERLSAAVAGGTSLETAARAEGLTLERTGVLRRRPDGFLPGLGPAQEVQAVAFSLEAGESSDRIFELPDKLVLVQVLERSEPTAEEVEAQIDSERERLRNAKLGSYLQTWIAQRREQLLESGQLVVNMEALGRS
ncbi:MAG: peptidylprolyl isomerase [Myxococcota bacterium]|nr:peptidylprolyl isomerase [Myxococcota bacterium]